MNSPTTPANPFGQKPLPEFPIAAARLMADLRCDDVRLLDVRGLSQVCDFVLIGTGTSNRQMKSVAQELAELGEQYGEKAFRKSTDGGATWVVIDFVDLVAHLFEPSQREYYDLETLWADGREIPWQREDGKPRAAASPEPEIAADDADEEEEIAPAPKKKTKKKVVKKKAPAVKKKTTKKTARKPATKTTRKKKK